VDEITPDLVARMASRIYNEAPQPNGSPAPEAVASGFSPAGAASPGAAMPEMPTTPMSIPAHLGSIPVSVGSWPHSAAPVGMPSPGLAATPGVSALPTFAGAPSAGSSAPTGLQGFVAKIRQSHFSGREQRIEPSGLDLRQRLSSGQTVPLSGSRPLDVPAIREDFPILRQRVHGKPLAWLDNAATTQKPQSVIDAISHFYQQDNSNIHRAAHTLAARATDAFEGARQKVQTFLGASSTKEIVFVRGTTEGINLVTQTYGRKFLQPGDEVVLSTLEHHANIVPWQMVAKEKGAVLRIIPVNDRGEVMLEEYQKILGPRTKVVALAQASNSLGTILPVAEMTQMAKRYGARVLIDGAQSVAHIPVNLQQMGCDFFVFSGHKIFGPTGIGAVYIKEELHDILPPWQGGGNMIRNVTFEETTFADAPARFEAGTPNIADAVGLGAALDYVNRLGLPSIAAYEHELLEYATAGLLGVNGLRLIGTAREKVGVLSFVLPNRRTEDVGRMLDQEGIAVRAGHHCSQPSLRRFGVETTVRPSLAFYNTTGEIDRLVDAVKRIQRLP
jgi:cysteine desulfurase / selenocysteine lyase